MKKKDLAQALARQTRQTPAQASDEVDKLVHQILSALREGRPVDLPGVGKLVQRKASRRGKR